MSELHFSMTIARIFFSAISGIRVLDLVVANTSIFHSQSTNSAELPRRSSKQGLYDLHWHFLIRLHPLFNDWSESLHPN